MDIDNAFKHLAEGSLTNLKEQIEERKKPINTSTVQMDSLQLFMYKLGYKVNGSLSRGFKAKIMTRCQIHQSNYISFENACILHNGIVVRVVGSGVNRWFDMIGLPLHVKVKGDVYNKALKEKLVKRVKLQKDKKQPLGIEVQDHWVEFVEEGN